MSNERYIDKKIMELAGKLDTKDKKIAALEQQLTSAKEVIAFYADPDNWSSVSLQECSRMLGDDHQCADEPQIAGSSMKGTWVGGKRAREWQKQHGVKG